MTIQHSWAQTILARRHKRVRAAAFCLVAVLCATAPPAPAQQLDALVRAQREKPTAATAAALRAYRKAQTGVKAALADFALGQLDLENERNESALANLQAAAPKLPLLSDYCANGIGRALFFLGKKPESIRALETAAANQPVSPLKNQALLLSAQSYIDLEEPARAVELLRRNLNQLPMPSGLIIYGTALAAAGAGSAAAVQMQRVYYEFPISAEAETAAKDLAELESRLAADYPPVTGAALLGRATKLSEAGKHKEALVELNAMLPKLAGLERDLAQVRIGATRLRAGETLPALSYLTSLNVKSPEADAERLHYAATAARRAARLDDAHQALHLLDEHHAQSPWRLETLISVGNHYLLLNQPEMYDPLFRACADSFPSEARAAYCHWRVTWNSYLNRQGGAGALLKRHLELFPESEQAPAALYYLGRLSEDSGDAAAAKSYYLAILARYPNYYYAVVARERLSERPVSAAGLSPAVGTILSALRLTPAGSFGDFQPDQATQLRIERARLLSSAGFADMAETELRFAAKTDSKPAPLAIELAQSASRRGAFDKSLRYIKSVSPGYLNWDLKSAPSTFWLLAFPMPFRQSLEKHSKQNDLDPNLVAALVRQESEFDPKAVSRSRAVGLTQVLPGTGREISRKLGLQYRTSMLYQPDSNLQLGTFYLKRLVDSLDGNWEAALAAYNAGKSRTLKWLSWGQFREPSEFIETIPFYETRDYVQTVLRNADIYRRLYSATAAAVPSSGGNSSSQAVRSAGRPDAPDSVAIAPSTLLNP